MKRLLCVVYAMALLMVGSCVREQNGSGCSNSDDTFRMQLRLWPAHHTDTQLRDDLIDALTKYQGVFDEVWLCAEFQTLSMESHRSSAKMMGQASELFRKAGLDVSFQGISIGHGDSFESGSDELRPKEWTTIKDAYGNQTQLSHCPRHPAFLKYMSESYATYAKECNPRVAWIDDDLRVTSHHPARMLCFCDRCIGEFNKEYGGKWDFTSLTAALDANYGNGTLRKEWIEFSQGSLALVAEAVAKGVHEVVPDAMVGIQQVNFHRELLEGRDWNKSYDAINRITGHLPTSRPGNGFYNDHSPRGMIDKAYDMARQVRRLNPNIKEVTAEVEGYRHCATGKSPKGLSVESMLYLSMGVTQLSYAIICAAVEPMEWYADNYFEMLRRWRPMYEEYASFNQNTRPAGIDPYISPDMDIRDAPNWGWTTTASAGDVAISMATLGVPFAPDAASEAVALAIDAPAAWGLTETEAEKLYSSGSTILDTDSWAVVKARGHDKYFTPTEIPDGLGGAKCYLSSNGGRMVVLPNFTMNVTSVERLEMMRAMDWAAMNRLPVVIESMAQAIVVPRCDADGVLRSVMLLNCSISEQLHSTKLRLRGCPAGKKPKAVWHVVGQGPERLLAKQDGDDWVVELPALEGWNAGWLSIE